MLCVRTYNPCAGFLRALPPDRCGLFRESSRKPGPFGNSTRASDLRVGGGGRGRGEGSRMSGAAQSRGWPNDGLIGLWISAVTLPKPLPKIGIFVSQTPHASSSVQHVKTCRSGRHATPRCSCRLTDRQAGRLAGWEVFCVTQISAIHCSVTREIEKVLSVSLGLRKSHAAPCLPQRTRFEECWWFQQCNAASAPKIIRNADRSEQANQISNCHSILIPSSTSGSLS